MPPTIFDLAYERQLSRRKAARFLMPSALVDHPRQQDERVPPAGAIPHGAGGQPIPLQPPCKERPRC